MVLYGIKYFDKIIPVTIYDTWDIADKKHSVVSKISNVTPDDVGKYLKLNDGSKQYVKILSVWKNRVNTSSGLYYTDETICMVNPRIPGSEYCGAKAGDESFAVVPVRDSEREDSRELLAKGKSSNKVTKRISALTTEEMKAYIIAKGYTEESVIDKTLQLAFGQTNQHTINALKAIDKVFATELFNEKKEDSKQLTLAARFGLGNIRSSRMQIAEVVSEQTGD